MIGNWFRNLDYWVLFSVLGLLTLSLMALYSSTVASGGVNYFEYQCYWIAIGLVLMIITSVLPFRWIFASAYWLYGLAILTLVAVIFFGSTGYGATRWIRIGFLRFQPSELAKIATILAVSRFLSSDRIHINKIKDFGLATFIIFVPFLLIVGQPDLGTALVFAAMALPIYLWAGLAATNLVLIVTPFIVLLASFQYISFFLVMVFFSLFLFLIRKPVIIKTINFIINIFVGLITPLIWNQLKDYQKQRIRIFWKPESDPLGAGYQVIQSKVAIGSGGFFGKGFLKGSQTQLRFLPEQHTDFIYAVIGEEFGWLGVFSGIFFFTIFLIRCVIIASQVKNKFSGLCTIGIGTVIGFHMLVNMGMTIGLLPVTGLPLPFISYGGSAMLTNLMMVGLLFNFYRNRFEY